MMMSLASGGVDKVEETIKRLTGKSPDFQCGRSVFNRIIPNSLTYANECNYLDKQRIGVMGEVCPFH
jgi:hypothetical protein